ncbi:MAG: uracil-DNA glycosylase family protein, partial [Flavobacteriales bacterium]
LTNWAQQGVFLLNTVLSVQAGNSNSHAGQGWETFTNKVIKEISDNSPNVVYMLWGAHAQKKQKLINDSQNLIRILLLYQRTVVFSVAVILPFAMSTLRSITSQQLNGEALLCILNLDGFSILL